MRLVQEGRLRAVIRSWSPSKFRVTAGSGSGRDSQNGTGGQQNTVRGWRGGGGVWLWKESHHCSWGSIPPPLSHLSRPWASPWHASAPAPPTPAVPHMLDSGSSGLAGPSRKILGQQVPWEAAGAHPAGVDLILPHRMAAGLHPGHAHGPLMDPGSVRRAEV